jgi:ATP-dependent Clp protease ATP-binding subunit ClpA
MFERYTEHARRVIFHARHTASQSGSLTIETEHLLLGLLRETGPLITRLAPGVSIEVLDRKVPQKTVTGGKAGAPLIMPLSPECKRILNYSAEEANGMNHRCIGAGHLLLAVLREEGCVAARLLGEAGVQLEPTRERLAADTTQSGDSVCEEWIPSDVGREKVHALVDELPEKMLAYAKIAIDHMLATSRAGFQQDLERAAARRRLAAIRPDTGAKPSAGPESKFL